MPRRGENIYRRKDGRWEGRVLGANGKYCYVYAKTYKEVKEKQKNYQEQVLPKAKIEPSSTTSAARLFENWITGDVIGQVKPSTYGTYYCCIQKYILPFFEQRGHECISERTAAEFVKLIKDQATLSEAYKKKILTIFKTALMHILKTAPTRGEIMQTISLPKTDYAEVQVFSISEQRSIENASLYSNDKRMLGVLLCFYTGIRLGELCSLKWCDLDYEAGTISITKTVTRVKNLQLHESKTKLLVGSPKSKKSIRKIPLPNFLLQLLIEWKKQTRSGTCYILSGVDIPLDPRCYQKLYQRLLLVAGVKYRKFHAIRHTFATRALELGVDIKTLSEILGHSNVSITLNIYAHSLMEQKKIVMDKLNEMHNTHMVDPIAVTDSVISA